MIGGLADVVGLRVTLAAVAGLLAALIVMAASLFRLAGPTPHLGPPVDDRPHALVPVRGMDRI